MSREMSFFLDMAPFQSQQERNLFSIKPEPVSIGERADFNKRKYRFSPMPRIAILSLIRFGEFLQIKEDIYSL